MVWSVWCFSIHSGKWWGINFHWLLGISRLYVGVCHFDLRERGKATRAGNLIYSSLVSAPRWHLTVQQVLILPSPETPLHRAMLAPSTCLMSSLPPPSTTRVPRCQPSVWAPLSPCRPWAHPPSCRGWAQPLTCPAMLLCSVCPRPNSLLAVWPSPTAPAHPSTWQVEGSLSLPPYTLCQGKAMLPAPHPSTSSARLWAAMLPCHLQSACCIPLTSTKFPMTCMPMLRYRGLAAWQVLHYITSKDCTTYVIFAAQYIACIVNTVLHSIKLLVESLCG